MEAAKIISLQTDEKVFRWGGDEFAVFFKNSKDVEKTTENIRKAFEVRIKENYNFGLDTTVSIGAVSIFASALSATTLLKEADKCLYEAKSQGRNRIIYKKITL